jgi:DNA-binding NarL/FixJ family response regulator
VIVGTSIGYRRVSQVGERRVFVLWRHPLFYESVRLLLRHPAVAMVGATSDDTNLQEMVAALKPDVVIVETAGEEDQRPVPTDLLETVANLLSLNLSDNELSVYSRRDRIVGDARELLSLVLEDRPAGDAEVRGA